MYDRRGVRAAFLDRDGTIIVDRDYTNNPDDVLLLPGAASAIAALSAAGISSIVITNQSGIARGLVSIAQYHAVRRRIDDVLRGEGAELRDTFACPHHPDFTGPCVCRKPATGLYERAAAAHGIDLERSFYIGDRMRDIAAAQAFGGTAVLVRSPATSAADIAYARDHDVPIADSLSDAVARLLAGIQ